MLNLQVITASTRAGRQGPARGAMRPRGLPLLDEPEHPRLRKYAHEHTRRWSAIVERADAYVFVTPEYNYGMPPSLLNALDFVVWEWAYKPLGLVSYGGVSGGLRSAQMIKLPATALRMMPIPEAVSLPLFTQHLDEETGAFTPPASQERAVTLMLDELLRWAEALQPMRAARPG